MLIENAEQFRKIIDSISVLIDEAEFCIGEEGLSLRATDPSQISMIDFFMPKNAFLEYNIESTKIGMDLSYLSKIMARTKAGEKLKIEIKEGKNTITFCFEGESKRRFQVPLLNISGSELPNPKIEFDGKIKMDGNSIQNSLKDAGLISDHVIFSNGKEGFRIYASSTKGEFAYEGEKGKDIRENEIKEEAKSMFPLNYLQDMLKSVGGEDVEISLKTNAPMKIEYNLGKARIIYFLAPRIESD